MTRWTSHRLTAEERHDLILFGLAIVLMILIASGARCEIELPVCYPCGR